MKLYRAVLAVDHYNLLADARSVIRQHPNLVLAGEAAVGIELLTLLTSASADLAVFSIATPSHRKREVIHIVTRQYPRLKLFFIHQRLPTPTARGTLRSSPWDIASGYDRTRFGAFYTHSLRYNLFHRQSASLLVEH